MAFDTRAMSCAVVAITLTGCAGLARAPVGTGSPAQAGSTAAAPPPSAPSLPTYCDAARAVQDSLTPLPATVDEGTIAERAKATHTLLAMAPGQLRDDIEVVLLGDEAYMDAVNGDVSADRTADVRGATYRDALAAIERYDVTRCGMAAASAAR